MNQRLRISIMALGVVISTVMGLILKDSYNCLITGVIVASAITVMLSQQAKRGTDK